MDHVSLATVQLAFDETELYLQVSRRGERGFFHVLMAHARVLLVFENGTTRRDDFVIPPATIQDTSSRALNKAIMQRAAFLFELPADRFVLIQNSDKAKSCVRQALHFSGRCQALPGQQFVFSNCLMHMAWTSIVSACSQLNITGPMFCATCLIHRGNNMVAVKKSIGIICECAREICHFFPRRWRRAKSI